MPERNLRYKALLISALFDVAKFRISLPVPGMGFRCSLLGQVTDRNQRSAPGTIGVVSKHLTFAVVTGGSSRNRTEGEAESVGYRSFDHADDCHF